MSRDLYNDDCPGCRLALIDPATGKVLPEDDPLHVKASAAFDRGTRAQREAFHRMTCLNSGDVTDLILVAALVKTIEAECK